LERQSEEKENPYLVIGFWEGLVSELYQGVLDINQ